MRFFLISPSMSVLTFATAPIQQDGRRLSFDIANPRLDDRHSASSRLLMKVGSTVTVIAGFTAGDDRGFFGQRSAAPAFRVWRRKVLGSIPASTGNMCSGPLRLTPGAAPCRSNSGVTVTVDYAIKNAGRLGKDLAMSSKAATSGHSA